MNEEVKALIKKLRARTRAVYGGAGLYEVVLDEKPDELCAKAADALESMMRREDAMRDALREAEIALDDAGDQFWHLSREERRADNPWVKQCFAARDKARAALEGAPVKEGD